MQKFTFKWNTHLYVSLFLSVCCSAHPSAPYLRNRTLCDHNFFYTGVKWWYLQGLFHFYEILIFWAVRGGGGGEKTAQNEKYKLYPSHTISQEQYCIWSSYLADLFKMMIYPCVFPLFVFKKDNVQFGILSGNIASSLRCNLVG